MLDRLFSPHEKPGSAGVSRFYPVDLSHRSTSSRTWRSVAARYGFEEYDGPPLEPLELYTAKSGDEIVGQLYDFTDKGQREVALRPEMTPTLARMVAASAKRSGSRSGGFPFPNSSATSGSSGDVFESISSSTAT